MERSSDRELRQLDHYKRGPAQPEPLIGPEMVAFFKQSVQKRHTKLSQIAECWGRLVPEALNEHCSLESYSRGSLCVIVDSSSHLYELKQLLLAGLQQQLLIACKSAGLKKITLKPGRWYEGNEQGDRKIRFGD